MGGLICDLKKTKARREKVKIKKSRFEASKSVLSLVYQDFVFALKSPTTINNEWVFFSHMIKI